jgi:putative transposase
MKTDPTKPVAEATEEKLFDNWFDPVETDLRTKVRGLIETMIEEELETVLSRPPYGRRPGLAAAGDAAAPVAGHRHGHRTRTLTGTFGKTGIAVPRARIYRTCLASPIRCSSGFAVGLWPGRSRV